MIRHAALALLLLLLLLLLACPMLRVTGEPANNKRYINAVPYEDGLASIASFETHDISHYGPLFIDASRGFLIVGARDAILKITLDSLVILQRVDVPASSDQIDRCYGGGKDKVKDCRNFIRMIAQESNNSLLICSTGAFRPTCSIRNMENFNLIGKIEDGIGYAPYDPNYSLAYVITENRQVIVGVSLNFVGTDEAIVRIRPANKQLRTMKNDKFTLNGIEPHFVAAFEIGPFVYFFFHEIAIEHFSHRQIRYSRVARLCKNDTGASKGIYAQAWTSFLKSRLICQEMDKVIYDIVQDVQFLPSEKIFYAIFTSSEVQLPGSAVCVYSLESLESVFRGPFLSKHVQPPYLWRDIPNPQPNYMCEQRLTDFLEMPKLMYNVILPISSTLLEQSSNESYTHLSVDTVRVKNDLLVTVLFVLEVGGILKKFVHMNDQLCLIEVVELTPPGKPLLVNEMKLVSSKGMLYLSMEERLMRVPVQRCSNYKSRERCMDAKDPYCAWNMLTSSCTKLKHEDIDKPYWHQSAAGCPNKNISIDGKFGPWSEWMLCERTGGGYAKDEGCMCRRRNCDSPAAQFGGKPCQEASVQVANCTRHGNWTEWSAWSSCSATCGRSSIRIRSRHCTNPAPAFNGRACLGPPQQQEQCHVVEHCPKLLPPPIHGQWSAWSPWRPCSKPCGTGTQKRTRTCDNPSPLNGGDNCVGADEQLQTCNESPCKEVRKWSEWTPWLQVDAGPGGQVVVKRYRLSCSARVENASLIAMSPLNSQRKVCLKSMENCLDGIGLAVGWSPWTEWSACSEVSGIQQRERSCVSRKCAGPSSEKRPCTSACKGCLPLPAWSCWSDYTACSCTGESSVRRRWRSCLGGNSAEDCAGQAFETASCVGEPCPTATAQDLEEEEDSNRGLSFSSSWSAWSRCNEIGLRARVKLCPKGAYCDDEPDMELHRCADGETLDSLNALQLREDAGHCTENLVIVVAVVGGLIACILLALMFVCCARFYPSLLCYTSLVSKQQQQHRPVATSHHPPTPKPAKSNIYTPPPSIRSHGKGGSATTHITLNPLDRLSVKDLDGLTEQETQLTLKRTMRTSLNTKDYL
ncbi:Semaphorin-5A [Trichinella spiralis]|uniref:Semaphorin-5A n=1 Tax=Trichinella spiralis TaxID=6334 RepID=A0A0V1BX75_TRISP|nr:Semaphorin-5A [Trichinella spiralis]